MGAVYLIETAANKNHAWKNLDQPSLKMKLGGKERNIPAWIQDHISQAQNFINQANTNFHEDNDFKNDATIAENDMSAEDEFNQLMKQLNVQPKFIDAGKPLCDQLELLR